MNKKENKLDGVMLALKDSLTGGLIFSVIALGIGLLLKGGIELITTLILLMGCIGMIIVPLIRISFFGVEKWWIN